MTSMEPVNEYKTLFAAIQRFLSTKPGGAKTGHIVAALKADEEFLGASSITKKLVNSALYHHGTQYGMTKHGDTPPLWVYAKEERVDEESKEERVEME